MRVDDVMAALAAAVEVIPGLRVTAYPPDRLVPPAAWPEWPDAITYDAAMGRGADQITAELRVCVGRVDARSSLTLLADYAAGAGPRSVKAAVESFTTAAYHSARVTTCQFGVVSVAGTEYLATTFSVDIIGS
ncbi:hypothetical protein [Pseudonocardia hydrocarbonoxydans]|uniref:Uncharacterized protein n=1 Tax=Pseudonocardia hydrocarbonoxydans TaxID=76726 RepID=A0A4Y3WQ20_9PSEU|nr:hypothetical protein [Pseudonocardia hydrocarbonoxydans]GEC20982.1 hypothetical protein PHY01_32650 [Pseudonocardia hydrocarbonoxydans]